MSWNAAAERIFGYTAEEMIGSSIRRLIPADRQQEEDAILASVSRGEIVPMFETVRLRKNGEAIFVAVTVSPVRDADRRIIAASKIARDITEQKRMQARLDETEMRFRLMADNISQLAWIADPDGNVIWYNQRWSEFTGLIREGARKSPYFDAHHPEHRDRVFSRWRAHLASGEVWEDTFPLRGADGRYRWFLSRAAPFRDAAGAIVCWFGTNTDVTEMRDAEQRIELLLMEVNHRAKNMLAMIQSLARRTVADGGDYVSRLEQRIRSLAANQDLLVHRSWSSVPVAELVDVQLQFLGDAVLRQVSTRGADAALSPGGAEAISMALHEMATNAIKYGALSVPSGKVVLEWGIDAAEGRESRFWMDWRETGGPAVIRPESPGFGSRIIADVPRSKLDGVVTVDFAPAGFHWRLECPVGKSVGPA